MSALEWFDTVPGLVGFGRITATRRAFRSIFATMLPVSITLEFFGEGGVLS